jgi:phosphotriesterase-related protein
VGGRHVGRPCDHGHGVQTVVEPSAMFLHRDAAFSKRVADESGLNVILATGVYT